MGCRTSMPEARNGGPHIDDKKFETQAPPKKAGALPLTQMQIFKLKKSWKGVKREQETTGVELFVRLFKEHPALFDVFDKFGSFDRTDLWQCEVLREHAPLVLDGLTTCVENIDDDDTVLSFLTSLASTHSKIPGFQADLVMSFRDPLIGAIQTTLGDRYSDAMAEAYTVAIDYILKTFVEKCNAVTNET